MQDAAYFRAQAQLCLELARQLSDQAAAERTRLTAVSYLARAEELESGAASNPAVPPTR
jgi:hypothetical protein